MGPRIAMFLAALPYTLFAAMNWGLELELVPGWTLLPCGVGVGVGCGLLHGAQGVYVVQISREYDGARRRKAGGEEVEGSLGLFSGVAQAGSQVGGLLALFASSVLMQHDVPRTVLTFCFLACLAAGNLLLLALPSAHVPKSEAEKPGRSELEAQAASLWAVPRLMWRSRELRLLMICNFVSTAPANCHAVA